MQHPDDGRAAAARNGEHGIRWAASALSVALREEAPFELERRGIERASHTRGRTASCTLDEFRERCFETITLPFQF